MPAYKADLRTDRVRPPPEAQVRGPPQKPTLYPFQAELVDRARAEFKSHRRVLLVLPTGGGKTSCFSFITEAAAVKGKRVMVVVHRVEIVRQIVDRLATFDVKCGEIHPKAPLTTWPVQVGMIQTVARRLAKLHKPDFIVVDETHHAVSSQFRAMLDFWPDVPVLGVTATPLRLDGKGLSEVFQAMVVGPSMRWLIDNGYLADFDLYAPAEKIDLSGISSRAGEYKTEEVEALVNTRTITGNAVEHYARFLGGKPAIAFCVSIAHCRDVRDQFREAGWTADIIDGTMDDRSRQALVKRLANGSLNILVSCNVVNEGFDVPVVAGAILLRPTKSLAMYLQTIGRALRKKPDGSRAIVLDHAGNVHRFGPPDVNRDWSLEGKMVVEAKSHHCTSCEKIFKAGTKRSEITEQCPAYETCPLLRVKESASGEAKAPEVVDGELTAYKPPDWTGGVPLQSDVAGADYRKLMERSEGRRDRLEQIRVARGYKPGWTHFKMEEFDQDGNWLKAQQ